MAGRQDQAARGQGDDAEGPRGGQGGGGEDGEGEGQGLDAAGRVEGGGGEAETGDASDPGECERAGGHLGKYFSSWSPLVSILQDGQSDVMVTAPALETLLTILDARHYYGEHQHISPLCSFIFLNSQTKVSTSPTWG